MSRHNLLIGTAFSQHIYYNTADDMKSYFGSQTYVHKYRNYLKRQSVNTLCSQYDCAVYNLRCFCSMFTISSTLTHASDRAEAAVVRVASLITPGSLVQMYASKVSALKSSNNHHQIRYIA